LKVKATRSGFKFESIIVENPKYSKINFKSYSPKSESKHTLSFSI
jgi:hypothetical protein